MNADDFFSNSAGSPRPFLNFNEWVAGAQGPIWKNHTFFDADYEGTHVLLPTNSTLVLIPTPQFQSATLANLTAVGNGSEIPFYQQMFGLYNGARGAASAIPATSPNGGCGDFTALGPGVPCALQFRATSPNKLTEYLWSGRVDHNFSERDRAYVRVWRDKGYQPTYTDPINPQFNDFSNQPQMSAQFSESHTFSPTAVNQFNASLFYYAAVFLPEPNAAGAFPTAATLTDGSFYNMGGAEAFVFPQGRRVTQHQVLDDFSKIHGRHTIRLGFSWLHDNVTDLDFGENAIGYLNIAGLPEYYHGGGASSFLSQSFPSATEQAILLNTFGGYIADEWRVANGLTLSLNLRLENYANPTCPHNCFARLANTFTGLPANANTSYNQVLLANQHDAYPNTQTLVWEPRIGIAWKPAGSDNTVIRAGAGVFADELPASMAEWAALISPGRHIQLQRLDASGTASYIGGSDLQFQLFVEPCAR